jgi:thiol-disulfide isomerase/thioredoxin
MKNLPSLLLTSLILIVNQLFAQDTRFISLSLHDEKMSDTRNIGRLLGRPVDPSNFKIDSTGYFILYVCEVSLTSRNDPDNTKLHYLIGQKKKDELLVTVDKNCNNSFLDDSVIVIKLPNCNKCDFSKSQDFIPLNIDNFGKNYEKFSLHIIPPYLFKNLTRHSNYPFLDTLNIALEAPFEKIGYVSDSGKTYQISIRNIFPRANYKDKNNLEIHISNMQSPSNINIYGAMDTLKIGKTFYLQNFLSKKADTLILEKIPSDAMIGYEVGFFSYNFHEKDISSNTTIGLSDFHNKYMLMEFWGTWCGPCLSLHDNLVAFLDKHKNLSYLGIALDKNIDLVKKYVSNSPELKEQIFVDMNSGNNSMPSKFRVTNYPTFILMDAKGKILYRNFGIEGFNGLVSYFEKK